MMREIIYYPAVGELPRFAVRVNDCGEVIAETVGDGWNPPHGAPVIVGTIAKCSGYIAAPPEGCAWEWWPGGGPEGTDEWPAIQDAATCLVDAYAWGTFGQDDARADACEGAA